MSLWKKNTNIPLVYFLFFSPKNWLSINRTQRATKFVIQRMTKTKSLGAHYACFPYIYIYEPLNPSQPLWRVCFLLQYPFHYGDFLAKRNFSEEKKTTPLLKPLEKGGKMPKNRTKWEPKLPKTPIADKNTKWLHHYIACFPLLFFFNP